MIWNFQKGATCSKFRYLDYTTGTGMPALYRIWTTGMPAFLQSFLLPGHISIALPATYDCTTAVDYYYLVGYDDDDESCRTSHRTTA